jgi:hypothetical protein
MTDTSGHQLLTSGQAISIHLSNESLTESPSLSPLFQDGHPLFSINPATFGQASEILRTPSLSTSVSVVGASNHQRRVSTVYRKSVVITRGHQSFSIVQNTPGQISSESNIVSLSVSFSPVIRTIIEACFASPLTESVMVSVTV